MNNEDAKRKRLLNQRRIEPSTRGPLGAGHGRKRGTAALDEGG